MAWPWLTTAAKAIPWTALVRRAPEIIDASARLLAARKTDRKTANVRSDDDNLRERLRVLESNDRENAKVVEQLAEQVRDLTQSAQVLAARFRVFAVVVVTALVVFFSVGALVWLS